MPTNPTSSIHNISREEYAALAKPFVGQWKRLIVITLVGGSPAALIPLIVMGTMYAAISSSPNGALMAHRMMAVIFMRLWPFFLAFPCLYIVIAVSRVWSIIHRRRVRLKRLFPDRKSRQTITTQILPIGIVQTSAGASSITPWANVVRVLEVREGYILQTQNLQTPRWNANLENLYILRSNAPTEHASISLPLLEDFRSNSTLLPNYTWQAALVGPGGGSPPPAIWPPPPSLETPKSEIGIPIAGTIYLPTFDVMFRGPSLSFKYTSTVMFQRVFGALAAPVVLFLDFYRFITPANTMYWVGISLAICGLFWFLIWRSNLLITVNREASQITVLRRKFAAIAEIDALTVADLKYPVFFGNGRKLASITIRKANGKSQRLPIIATSGAGEVNVIAMILGEFLTESISPSNPVQPTSSG
jgi:hypothetical protein